MTLLHLGASCVFPNLPQPNNPPVARSPKVGLDKSHMYTAVDQRPIATYVSDKGLGTGVGWPNLVTH